LLGGEGGADFSEDEIYERGEFSKVIFSTVEGTTGGKEVDEQHLGRYLWDWSGRCEMGGKWTKTM
jgi:hypothetical protein